MMIDHDSDLIIWAHTARQIIYGVPGAPCRICKSWPQVGVCANCHEPFNTPMHGNCRPKTVLTGQWRCARNACQNVQVDACNLDHVTCVILSLNQLLNEMDDSNSEWLYSHGGAEKSVPGKCGWKPVCLGLGLGFLPLHVSTRGCRAQGCTGGSNTW